MQATSQIDLTELAKTGRGTLMGDLLRRFWQPIAASVALPAGRAMPVRIMGEDLTLFRGEGGAPHLVAARCAHRLSLLYTGWIEEDTIRCMYHGWRYDGSGQCVEAPAEDAGFCQRVKITAYPAREYAGMIFVYLGPGDPPAFDLPRHPEVERTDGLHWIQPQVWDCNWLQSVENSLDAVHVSFVHRWGKMGPFGAAVTDVVPKLQYEETDSGIRQTAFRSANNVRVSDWTFPNHNHIVVPGLHSDDPWTHTFPWMVPIDDEHVLRIQWQYAAVEGEGRKRLEEYLNTHGYEPTGNSNEYYGRDHYNPANHHEELFMNHTCPEPLTNELTNAQDYVAQVGQGAVVDRTQERLGRSDQGVIFLRSLYLREMAALRDGRTLKQWTRLKEAVQMPIQDGDTGQARGWERASVASAR